MVGKVALMLVYNDVKHVLVHIWCIFSDIYFVHLGRIFLMLMNLLKIGVIINLVLLRWKDMMVPFSSHVGRQDIWQNIVIFNFSVLWCKIGFVHRVLIFLYIYFVFFVQRPSCHADCWYGVASRCILHSYLS